MDPEGDPAELLELKEQAQAAQRGAADDNDDDGGDDDDEMFEMEEDVYTLLFVYGFRASTVYAAFIIMMQITIVGVFYVDLLKDGTDVNRFSLPVTVDTQVRIAQFLALPLAVMSHEDATLSIYQLSARYDPAILERFPNATQFQWVATLFLRFGVSFVLIFISFLQIMLSTTITDLFLNLEAIVFVGNIDNFAFWLAEKNFLKKQLRDDCLAVKDISFPPSAGERRTIFRRLFILLVYGSLIFGWADISIKQRRGRYLKDKACNTFTVNFPEEALLLQQDKIALEGTPRTHYAEFADLTDGPFHEMFYSSFSGTYEFAQDDKGRLERKEDRAIYLEVYPSYDSSIDDPTRGQFFYCEGAWIFTVPALQNAFNRTEVDADRKCGRWLMRSPPTEAFTLEEVGSDGWRIWTGDVEIAEGFSFTCNDCQDTVDCNYQGDCKDKRCDCGNTRFGSTCSFDLPCENLTALFFGAEGSTSEDFTYLATFSSLSRDLELSIYPNETLQVYNRPVYLETDFVGVFYYFIYYVGSRWSFSVWNATEFVSTFAADQISDGEAETRPPAHAFWDYLFEGTGSFYSEPTKSGSPIGLDWAEVPDSNARGNFGPLLYRFPVTLHLNCMEASCTQGNPCGDFGECNVANTECVCDSCYSGDFCQYSPYDPYVYDEFVQIWKGEPSMSEYYFFFLEYRDLPDECPNVFSFIANNTAADDGTARNRSTRRRTSFDIKERKMTLNRLP